MAIDVLKGNSGKTASGSVRIGEFNFEPVTGLLVDADNVTERLEPQTAAFLSVLAKRAGQIVSRDMLLTEVWNDRPVSDDAIRVVVKKLRAALGDDARNPRYIKTVPLKGYQLIAGVYLPSANKDEGVTVFRGRPMWAAVAAAVVAVTAFGIIVVSESAGPEPSDSIMIDNLTNLKGSELNADYSPSQETLVYSHRGSSEGFLTLMTTHVKTGKTQRLTWGEANYANAVWTPDGSGLAFTRWTEKTTEHFWAQFDTDKGLYAVQQLNGTVLAGKSILSWSASGQAIYVKDTAALNGPSGISRYEIPAETLSAVTAPSVAGAGDFYAQESPDGDLLAILRARSTSQTELLIMDLDSGALVSNRMVPFAANRLAWRGTSDALVLSGFQGGFFRFDIATDAFVNLGISLPHTNDVLFHCGDGCLFARQHNGNYLDVEERPNPFLPSRLLATDLLESLGADDLPIYDVAGEALYFVSYEPEGVGIKKVGRTSAPQYAAFLPLGSPIESLQISPSGETLAGVIGNRVFVYDFKSGSLSYVTSGVEQASNPTWAPETEALFYSLFEKGSHALYRHDLVSGARIKLMDNHVAIRQLDEGRHLVVDMDQSAWLLVADSEPQKLATLQSASPNQWQLAGETLYYTTREGNDSFLNAYSLTTDSFNKTQIGTNQFKLNFDVHPDEKKLALVKSLLAESNIVKITHSR